MVRETRKELERLRQQHAFRLGKVRKARALAAPDGDNQGQLMAMAWRLSLELVVATLVGMALGYGLDRLFGSAPWIMLVGLGLGFLAGMKNILRINDTMDMNGVCDTDANAQPAPGLQDQEGEDCGQ